MVIVKEKKKKGIRDFEPIRTFVRGNFAVAGICDGIFANPAYIIVN